MHGIGGPQSSADAKVPCGGRDRDERAARGGNGGDLCAEVVGERDVGGIGLLSPEDQLLERLTGFGMESAAQVVEISNAVGGRTPEPAKDGIGAGQRLVVAAAAVDGRQVGEPLLFDPRHRRGHHFGRGPRRRQAEDAAQLRLETGLCTERSDCRIMRDQRRGDLRQPGLAAGDAHRADVIQELRVGRRLDDFGQHLPAQRQRRTVVQRREAGRNAGLDRKACQ